MTGERPLDRRVHAYRADLAAAGLEGRVAAKRFVTGKSFRVRNGAASIKAAPSAGAPQTSQLLFGEGFTVYEEKDGWSWGQSAVDLYVGYVEASALVPGDADATHYVAALSSHLYATPDLKVPPIDHLPAMARVALSGETAGRFARLASGGWLAAAHLRPLGDWSPDYVATAARFLGIPYLWGGRAATDGFDCSGLVQIALAACGIPCPRDSDMQAAELGEIVAEGAALKRGDIVFFPGHVGIMWDASTLLHANAFEMCVSQHPLAEVIERVRQDHTTPLACVRRIIAPDRPGSPGSR